MRGPGSALGTGGALSVADRSRVISESLRQMARVSRFSDAKAVMHAPFAAGRGRRRDLVTPVLFALVFLLPALSGIAYFGLVASDRFVTEASFVLRPIVEDTVESQDSKSSSAAAAPASGVSQAMIKQDTQIVTEYVLSRPMVEALERQLPLRAMFSRPEIDYPSRLDPDKPIEKVLKYWGDRVSLATASDSNIVTVSVNAFTAQESLALTRAILAESERMINEFSLRSRNDALRESRQALARAEDQLTKVRLSMRDLRNKEGVLDGDRTAAAGLKMVSDLRSQRIQLAVRQSSLAHDLAPDARSMQELTTQIRHLDDTVAQLEQATTARTPQGGHVFSDTLGSFESLDVERKNADRYYAGAIAGYERARIIADRQIEFFNPVAEPVLAASPQQPRRTLAILVVIASAAAAFMLSLLVRPFLVGA